MESDSAIVFLSLKKETDIQFSECVTSFLFVFPVLNILFNRNKRKYLTYEFTVHDVLINERKRRGNGNE